MGAAGFNPRTPCGVRHELDKAAEKAKRRVSIHALLAECDPWTEKGIRVKRWFQSTHSLRSATSIGLTSLIQATVSIHALLAECDLMSGLNLGSLRCFNPRTPCGVRRGAVRQDWTGPGFNPRTPCGVRRERGYCLRPVRHRFQSTHSLRSATCFLDDFSEGFHVSIHALLAECDCA